MVALWFLSVACLATGSPATDCLAVSWVESGCGANVRHALPTVRGLMGVDLRWSPLPGWALDTTVGGSIGGALAIKHWKARKGAKWARHYGCGNVATAPGCLAYERRVRSVLMRLRPRKEV